MPPVCVACKVQMRCVKTGVDVELMAADQPHQIWNADRVKCEGCGIEVVTQFARLPVAEHFHARYAGFAKGVDMRFWGSMADKRPPVCVACGGTKEIFGPYGESIIPCPHCVIPQILDSSEDER